MKTIIALESHSTLESLSTIKRTTQAQIAATKAFPKTAALIRKLKEKIKLLKKQALKTYLKRKKDDAVKDAHKKSEHKTAKPAVHKTGAAKPVAAHPTPKPKKAHSSALVVLSAEVEDRMLERETDISDEDLAECCTLESTSAVSVQTKGEKKKESQQLKKSSKNPKAALRKKQMSAAMRIRENKKLRIEIKKLLEMKKKLQDKAWGLYVAKMKGKKAGKPVEKKAAKPATTGHPDIKSKEAKALVENAAKGKFDFDSAQKMESGDEKNAVFEEMQKHVKGEKNVGKHKKHLADALKKHGMSEKDYAQFLKDKHDNDKEFFSVHTRGPKDEVLVRKGAEKQRAAWAKKEKALKNHPGAAVEKELSKHKTYLGTHLQDWSDPSKGLEHR